MENTLNCFEATSLASLYTCKMAGALALQIILTTATLVYSKFVRCEGKGARVASRAENSEVATSAPSLA